jgi:hypothetical protein
MTLAQTQEKLIFFLREEKLQWIIATGWMMNEWKSYGEIFLGFLPEMADKRISFVIS